MPNIYQLSADSLQVTPSNDSRVTVSVTGVTADDLVACFSDTEALENALSIEPKPLPDNRVKAIIRTLASSIDELDSILTWSELDTATRERLTTLANQLEISAAKARRNHATSLSD